MNYAEYISYHTQGDAGVEERMIASLCHHFALSEWDSFRLIYYYTMTYHIPSALDMLLGGERDIKKLQFRTDRRYVRWLWNNPQAGQSPYKMFEGVMEPCGHDAEGNIIYKYNKNRTI